MARVGADLAVIEGSEADACVFCTRRDQPAPLFETPSLYAMPDKFPMRPGHTLLITKEHLSCLAAAPDLIPELEEAAARARGFLEQSYGGAVLAFENGIAGQTVFHAHLHLLPSRIEGIPAELLGHDDVTRVEGWDGVRERFAREGHYRYAELGGNRYAIAGYSPVLRPARRLLAEATGLVWGEHGFPKATSSEDVRDLERRWYVWTRDSEGPSLSADGLPSHPG